ncbi:hypothetical protein [Paenibacillus taichungensis]
MKAIYVIIPDSNTFERSTIVDSLKGLDDYNVITATNLEEIFLQETIEMFAQANGYEVSEEKVRIASRQMMHDNIIAEAIQDIIRDHLDDDGDKAEDAESEAKSDGNNDG